MDKETEAAIAAAVKPLTDTITGLSKALNDSAADLAALKVRPPLTFELPAEVSLAVKEWGEFKGRASEAARAAAARSLDKPGTFLNSLFPGVFD